jgi:hypothetical protein
MVDKLAFSASAWIDWYMSVKLVRHFGGNFGELVTLNSRITN